MNTLNKLKTAILAVLLFAGSVVAQDNGPAVEEQSLPFEGMGVSFPALNVVDFQPVQACFVPYAGAFVVIDSIDNSVDLIFREGDQMRRAGRFITDVVPGRYDLKNILRPKSLKVIGDKIVVLTSDKVDSSCVFVLGMQPVEDTLVCLAKIGFPCKSYAMEVSTIGKELIVVGNNPQGYDINILDITNGVENISADQVQSLHYNVPKQSDRIKASDPHGFGLTLVAVVVVFLALVCVALILKGYGKIIMKVQDRRANKSAAAKGASKAAVAAAPSTSQVAGEVYAAIATAIYLYDEEMHDEEDTVLTIQKVERAWTPWNAKFYNMNKYFNNRR